MSVRNDEQRTRFTDVSVTLNLLATDTPTTVGVAIIAAKAGHTIYIQRIAVHVRTVAAQVLTFQDNNGTVKEIAKLPASAAGGPAHVLVDEFEGVPLNEGKQFDITGAAGVAATIAITAFRRVTGVQTAAAYAAS